MVDGCVVLAGLTQPVLVAFEHVAAQGTAQLLHQ
jgi:hypothetical protein